MQSIDLISFILSFIYTSWSPIVYFWICIRDKRLINSLASRLLPNRVSLNYYRRIM